MLKGYTVPRSPLGIAEIDPPPPWHYSSDVIAVEYWADPEATAATLPPGLTPDPTTNGRAWMMFLDWQFTGEHDDRYFRNGLTGVQRGHFEHWHAPVAALGR